jgi:hypothetical protein
VTDRDLVMGLAEVNVVDVVVRTRPPHLRGADRIDLDRVVHHPMQNEIIDVDTAIDPVAPHLVVAAVEDIAIMTMIDTVDLLHHPTEISTPLIRRVGDHPLHGVVVDIMTTTLLLTTTIEDIEVVVMVLLHSAGKDMVDLHLILTGSEIDPVHRQVDVMDVVAMKVRLGLAY